MEEIGHPLSGLRRRMQLAADMQGYWSPTYGESREDIGSSPSCSSLRGLRPREEVSKSPGRSSLLTGERNVAMERRPYSILERSLTSDREVDPGAVAGDSFLCARASDRYGRWGGLKTSWLVKNSFEGWRSVHPRRFTTETRLFVPEEETVRRPRRQVEDIREVQVDVDVNAIASAVAEGLRVGLLEEIRSDLRRTVSQVTQLQEDLREVAASSSENAKELRISSARIGEAAREVRDVREAILNLGLEAREDSASISANVADRSQELKALVEGCSRDLLVALQESQDISVRIAHPPSPLQRIDVQVGDIARIEDRLSELTHAIDRIRIPNINPVYAALEETSSSLKNTIEESTGRLLQACASSRMQIDDRGMLEYNGKILEAIESLELSEMATCIRRVRQDVAPIGETIAKQQDIFLEAIEILRLEHSKVMESINKIQASCHTDNNEVLRAVRTLPRESNQAGAVVDAVQSALDASQRHIVHAIRDDVRLRFEGLVVEDRHSEVLQAIHRCGEGFRDKHSTSLEHVVSQVHLACDGISGHLKRDAGVYSAVEKCESAILDVQVLVRELLENSSNREDLLALHDAMQKMRRDTVKDVVERLEVAVDHSPLLEAIGSFEYKGHSELMSALKQIQLDLNMEPDFSPVLRALRDLPTADDFQKAHAESASVHVAVNAGTRKVLNALEACFGSRAIPQDRSPSPGRRKYVVTLGAEPTVALGAESALCQNGRPEPALSPGMQAIREVIAAGTTPAPQQNMAQAHADFYEARRFQQNADRGAAVRNAKYRKTPAQDPIAAQAVDVNGDGFADVVVVGVDKNNDGIPDALQVNPVERVATSKDHFKQRIGVGYARY